jgi:hypothetical protein
VIAFVRNRWPDLLALFLGATIGVFLLPLADIAVDAARGSYDDRNPVLISTGAIIERTDEHIEIAVHGRKLRACTYVSLSSFALGRDGILRDTFVLRVDMPATNATRPIGTQSLGVWRAWPVEGARSVQLWASHQCDGRLVRTLMAEVVL